MDLARILLWGFSDSAKSFARNKTLSCAWSKQTVFWLSNQCVRHAQEGEIHCDLHPVLWAGTQTLEVLRNGRFMSGYLIVSPSLPVSQHKRNTARTEGHSRSHREISFEKHLITTDFPEYVLTICLKSATQKCVLCSFYHLLWLFWRRRPYFSKSHSLLNFCNKA